MDEHEIKEELEKEFDIKFDLFYHDDKPLMCETVDKEFMFWFPTGTSESEKDYILLFDYVYFKRIIARGEDLEEVFEQFYNQVEEDIDRLENCIDKLEDFQ